MVSKVTTTALMMDVLYFHAAKQANEKAIKAQRKIDKAIKQWKKLDAKWEDISSKRLDYSDEYDQLEPLAPQIENADYEIGQAYGRQIKEISTVHILSCAALEAHINLIALEMLKDKEYDFFDKQSLEVKWLFIPKLLYTESFDISKEPYQSFSKLIKFRNKLVHYKKQTEEWESGASPKFLIKIGLTLADSKKSINTVINMIAGLASIQNIEPPSWVRDELSKINYFTFNIEKRGKVID